MSFLVMMQKTYLNTHIIIKVLRNERKSLQLSNMLRGTENKRPYMIFQFRGIML